MTEPRRFPIQWPHARSHEQRGVPEPVYMRAYEVYCALYGEQKAMVDLEGRNCRGGFGGGELVAFLYARSFPKDEWMKRTEEAFDGMLNL
jgi:hypothetical protein